MNDWQKNSYFSEFLLWLILVASLQGSATMTAPFTLLADAVRQHGSPLWAYDASTIAERVEQLKVFDTVLRPESQPQPACCA
jgi:hypothetical protein